MCVNYTTEYKVFEFEITKVQLEMTESLLYSS